MASTSAPVRGWPVTLQVKLGFWASGVWRIWDITDEICVSSWLRPSASWDGVTTTPRLAAASKMSWWPISVSR